MIKKRKEEYTAPTVELIEAHVEKGFQTSVTEDQLHSRSMEGVTNSGNNYTNELFS